MIITVIVLLILAGVSIATLIGENGIVSKAGNAAKKTNIASTKERLENLVVGSLDNENKIDIEFLENNIKKEFSLSDDELNDNEGDFPVTVSIGINKFAIEENGTVTENPLITMITSENYGDRINYSANGIDDWKIFYNDGSNVFIIASGYLENENLNDISEFSRNSKFGIFWSNVPSSNIDNESEIYDIFMLNWKKTHSDSTNINIKCVENLMNQNIFKRFCKDNISTYAIGSPTIEMYMESWNEKYPDKKLFYNLDNTSGYYIGITENPTGTTIASTVIQDYIGYQDSLYYPEKEVSDDARGYWIASPSKNGPSCLIYVRYDGSIQWNRYDTNLLAIRPVVCLKTKVKGTLNVDEAGNNIWSIE